MWFYLDFIQYIIQDFIQILLILGMTIFYLQSHKSMTSANYSHSKWSFLQMISVHGLLFQFLSHFLFKFNLRSFYIANDNFLSAKPQIHNFSQLFTLEMIVFTNEIRPWSFNSIFLSQILSKFNFYKWGPSMWFYPKFILDLPKLYRDEG